VLVDRFVTATSGSGTRGTFEASLAVDATTVGDAKLVAYERSAENGAEINTVTIPIRLSPR
jgi:germination protein M